MATAKSVWEPGRQVKVAAQADVVVAGGGIAGVSAALAAARSGAKVILLEKQCALGGLATLGLIIIYLPLCDGYGRKLIGGIGEELLLKSVRAGQLKRPEGKENPRASIPKCWQREASPEERAKKRYQVAYDAAPMMLALEQLLLREGIDIWYDSHLCGCGIENGLLRHVFVENKSGRLAISAKAYVDCTGDADLCFLAGEDTFSSDQNRRSGWYFGADLSRCEINLHPNTDPLKGPCPEGSRFYSGDDGRDVSQYIIDMHKFILDKSREYNRRTGAQEIPFLIPMMPLFRMTRRLSSVRDIAPSHIGLWMDDAVGMTGDWRKPALGYCVTLSSLYGRKTGNLLAAGRCMGAKDDAWDVLRVIPPCAVTGEAAGTAAAMLAQNRASTIQELSAPYLADILRERGVIINKELLEPMQQL
ncbi:MAG: FAD-dependent oxidoreductase [Christensenellales bacterium]|jgi:hypothetical protein